MTNIRNLKLVGITGTNGKTTISSLLFQLFKKAGFKVGLISTIKIMVDEVEQFLKECSIPNDKVWAMPAGDDRESLMESYGPVMNFVRDKGWRFTGRSHIMAFNTERCV